MEISAYDFEKALEDTRTVKVRILYSDGQLRPRWRAGEIGLLIDNDYWLKYDYFVMLKPYRTTENERLRRDFYFMQDEIEILPS